ncbi:MAG: Zn-dependent alcohol dehydrogenase [Chloroflexi bacterium]|nr:Zn-dependent alcohol dehydrogenase [Chloroflexota bacterium]
MKKMKAAVLYEPNTPLRVEEVTIDDPQEGEVMVRIVATGICHSDLMPLKGQVPGPLPLVPGHEGAGVVEKVGRGVTGLKAGDHVVLPVIFNCGRCRYCVEGQPALCSEVLPAHLMGTLPGGGRRLHRGGQDLHLFYSQGSFAEYVVVSERTAVKVPREAPLDVMCLLSCRATTGVGSVVNRAGLRAGESIVIYGCGGVGLSAVMGARLAGAGKIIAVDLLDGRLDLARELGADFVINASREDPKQRALEITGGGADYAIESIGNVAVMAQAFGSIHSAGTCVLVGAAPMADVLSLFPFEFLLGKTMKGSLLGNVRTMLDVPRYIDLYLQGRLPLEKLTAEYFTLDRVNEAIAAVDRGEVIRAVIRFD